MRCNDIWHDLPHACRKLCLGPGSRRGAPPENYRRLANVKLECHNSMKKLSFCQEWPLVPRYTRQERKANGDYVSWAFRQLETSQKGTCGWHEPRPQQCLLLFSGTGRILDRPILTILVTIIMGSRITYFAILPGSRDRFGFECLLNEAACAARYSTMQLMAYL